MPRNKRAQVGGEEEKSLSLLPVLAVFLGVLLVAVIEVCFSGFDSHKIPDVAEMSSLMGFAAVLALFFGPQWLFAAWASKAVRNSGIFTKFKREVADLFLFLPLWIPLWLVAASLFDGAQARSFSFGGWGPALLFVAFLAFCRLANRSWARLQKKSNGLAHLCLFLSAALCHFLDSAIYVGIYQVLHLGLGLVAIVCAAIAANSLIDRHCPEKGRVIASVVIVLCLFGCAYSHMSSFFRGPSTARAYLFQELVTTKNLIQQIPYRRKHPGPIEPSALSARFQQWNRERQDGRDRMQVLRGSEPLNLLFVSVDAVRRDHTSLHGYDRKTTPFLEELAKKAIVFDDARSPSTASFFSLMSTLSGAYPSSISLKNGEDPDFLGLAMKDAGYQSLGIFTELVFGARPPTWPKPDKRMGQDRHVLTTDESDVLVPQLLTTMNEMKSPFFLLTHLMDPHFPYHQRNEFEFGAEDIDAYDSEIAFTDQKLRELFEGMEESGILANTVVVIAADHGESFGEHGVYLHCGDPFEEQCRIPFMIYLPFMATGKRIGGTVSLTSLAPTLVDIFGTRELLDCEAPSLVPLMLDISDPKNYYSIVERPVISEREKFPAVSALIKGNHKLRIHHGAGLKQLFDIDADPEEATDLSRTHAQTYQAMSGLYQEWRSDCLFRREASQRTNREFELLRNEILLGRDDRIGDVFSLLKSSDLTLVRAAAYLLFDLEVSGRVTHDQGLCSVEISHKHEVVRGIQDLLAAKMEGRPLGAGAMLLDESDVEARMRASLTLWHLAKLPFAVPLARDRLEIEKVPQIRADLYATLAKAGVDVDFEKLMAMAVDLGGPVASRLIRGVMHLDKAELSEFIEQTLRQGDSLISHTIIQGLGAVDNDDRRDLVKRLLRLEQTGLRITTVGALRDFPRSAWLEDTLCKIVKHEPTKGLRIDAAKQLKTYLSRKASDALQDALSVYPESALTIGYSVLAKTRPRVHENWAARETLVAESLAVGHPVAIRLPKGSLAEDHSRRLYLTLLRDDEPKAGDSIEVADANGLVLLKRQCTAKIELFHVDLDVNHQPFQFPLSIQMNSIKFPKGAKVGNLGGTLIPLRTPLDLWPSDAKTMAEIGILQRFTLGWLTSLEHPNSCFLPAEGGGIRLRGAKAPRREVIFKLTTPSSPSRLTIWLNHQVIGSFKLEGGRTMREIRISNIAPLYQQHGPNLFSFAIDDNRAVGSKLLPLGEKLALHAVILK